MSKRIRLFFAALALVAAQVAALTIPSLPAELVPYHNAILKVESGGNPWVMFNNTTNQSFQFQSREALITKAQELIDRGHYLDIGLYQMNWRWHQQRVGRNLTTFVDPAAQEAMSKSYFLELWNQAKSLYVKFEDAIRMTVGAYNNGRVKVHNPGYANKVFAAAGLSRPYAVDGSPEQVASTVGSSAVGAGAAGVQTVAAGTSGAGGDAAGMRLPPWLKDTSRLLTPFDLDKPDEGQGAKDADSGLADLAKVILGAVIAVALLVLIVKFGWAFAFKGMRVAVFLGKKAFGLTSGIARSNGVSGG